MNNTGHRFCFLKLHISRYIEKMFILSQACLSSRFINTSWPLRCLSPLKHGGAKHSTEYLEHSQFTVVSLMADANCSYHECVLHAINPSDCHLPFPLKPRCSEREQVCLNTDFLIMHPWAKINMPMGAQMGSCVPLKTRWLLEGKVWNHQ